MPKSLSKFWGKWATPTNFLARVTGKTLTPGSRILPVNRKDDAAAEYRLDAGEKIGDKQNLVLQINSQARSPGLTKFVSRSDRGTHAKLATASFDTKAADPEAEIKRVIADMDAQAREKLGRPCKMIAFKMLDNLIRLDLGFLSWLDFDSICAVS